MSRGALLAALAVAVAGLALGACETTQHESTRLAKSGKTVLRRQGLTVRRENPDVRIAGTAVVHDRNGTAAVVALRNTGARDQAGVPVALSVKDAAGKALYRNDAPGLESSLVGVSLLPHGRTSYWVNNQIPVTAAPKAAEAKVGPARRRAPAAIPRIEVSKVHLGSDVDGAYARGVVTNRSKVEQKRLVISCVARRGARIVAAGRAVVDRVPPAPTAKPVRFTVYFIGNPKGATLELSAPPATF